MRRRRKDFLIFGAAETGGAAVANPIELLRAGWLGGDPRVGGLR
jgi:hypothetical protein